MNVRATNVLAGVKVGGVRVVVGTDYEALKNKPSINGVELNGNKTAADLGLGDATDYEALENKPKIAGVELKGDLSLEDLGIHDATDYEEISNKPSINGVTLEGDLSSEDLHIEGGGTTYEFSEGDKDGAFTVTPDGGEAQTVMIHGLQSFCFDEVLSEDEILTILNHEDDSEE